MKRVKNVRQNVKKTVNDVKKNKNRDLERNGVRKVKNEKGKKRWLENNVKK